MQAANMQTNAATNDPADKLIIALDVDSADEARAIVDELKGSVGAFKIGLRLFTAEGPKFVRELCEKGIKIFLDLKYHDIPNTVAQAGAEAAKLGVWMFNIHASGGQDMMKATADAVAEYCDSSGTERPMVIAVTVLTSSDEKTLGSIGVNNNVDDQVVSLSRLAKDSGLDGVVASAREASLIKDLVGKDLLIVTPGIRPLFATNDDQKRVMTAKQAIECGSDHLVVGRPVIRSADRKKAVADLTAEISS